MGEKQHLLDPDKGARIFGFDYPSYFARKRGYAFWITVPGNFQFAENDICKEKIFSGGMYALIFPIGRDPKTKEPVVVDLPEFTMAVFHENNQDSIGSEKAWDLYYEWSKLSGDYQKHLVFQAQDSLRTCVHSVGCWRREA